MAANSYLDCIDSYTLQNIAQYLTPDQRDVGALRLSCKYAASVIEPDKFIRKISALHKIALIMNKAQITPKELEDLARKYPNIFYNFNRFIDIITERMSSAHLRAIIPFINHNKFNTELIYVFIINDMIVKFIQSNCDVSIRADIIEIMRMLGLDDKKVVLTMDCITSIKQYLNVHRPTSHDEFNAILYAHNFVHENIDVNKYYIDIYNALICEQYCGDLFVDINCTLRYCNDTRRVFHIIEETGIETLTKIIRFRHNIKVNIAFWRELRALVDAKYEPINGSISIFAKSCALSFNIYEMLLYHISEDGYREFWRDVFMNDGGFNYIVSGTYRNDDLMMLITQICNVTDLENIFVNGTIVIGNTMNLSDLKTQASMLLFSRYYYNFNIDVFKWMCEHDIYDIKKLYQYIASYYYSKLASVGINMPELHSILIGYQPELVNIPKWPTF
jgi:hypothetical protein